MFITKKHLPRRSFLVGAGACIGLPLLDAMTPAAAKEADKTLRAAFVYVPHGVILNDWVPEETGSDYTLTPILQSLEPYKDQLQIFSGMKLNTDNTAGSGHATSSATWLSGAICKDTSGADVEAGKSIDQYIADHIRGDTVLPSMQLAIEDVAHMVGACDGTSSCAYINTVSWQEDNKPLPMEINPRITFERMFGYGATQEERLARTSVDRSLLDSIKRTSLSSILGARDKQRMSDYLDSVREVEVRVANLERKLRDSNSNLEAAPYEVPELYEDHVALQFEMLALAFQTDTSRVGTMMLSRELNQRTYPQIGVPEQHHGISHHGYNEERMLQHSLINTYHMQLFKKHFLDRIDSIEDQDGSILDNSLVVYGAGMGDGNVHSKDPLSNIILGRAGGLLKSGHHTDTTQPDGLAMPQANMLLSIMDIFGIHHDSIGHSNGRLDIAA